MSYEQQREHFEEYVADEGDQCDHCGRAFAEGEPFWANPRLAARYRYCSPDEGMLGPTEKSRKARFIRAVSGRF